MKNSTVGRDRHWSYGASGGVIALLFATAVLIAFARWRSAESAVAVFATAGTEVNLGIIEPDSPKLTRRISFENHGSRPLAMEYLGSSCGCVGVTHFDQVVAPQGSGEIRLEIDPQHGGKGQRMQRITFRTSDPQTPLVHVSVSWVSTDVTEVRISPLSVDAEVWPSQIVADPQSVFSPILLFDAWGGKLKVTGVSSTKNFVASVKEIHDRCSACPGDVVRHAFHVNLKPAANLACGTYEDTVEITTNHPSYLKVKVPVRLEVRVPVVAIPSVVQLGGRPGAQGVAEIRLTSKESLPVKIESVKAEGVEVKSSWEGLADGGAILRVEKTSAEGAAVGEVMKEGRILVSLSSPANSIIDMKCFITNQSGQGR